MHQPDERQAVKQPRASFLSPFLHLRRQSFSGGHVEARMNSISSKGPKDSKEFPKSDTDGNNTDSTKTSTARETFVCSNKKSRRKNQRKQNVNKVTEKSQSLETSESLDKKAANNTCEVLQSDTATELQDLRKSNRSLIWMMEKMTLAAEETKSINKTENDCLREKLEKANGYIAELEEDLSSSKKMWTDFEMMTTQYENEMKKRMEELENLKMNYQIMEIQWKEEITKRDEEIEMQKKENERMKNEKQKKEIGTLRNEKATVQISTANRSIKNNQLIEVSRAQKIDEEKKKYVVVLYNDFYNSIFETDNVVLIHFRDTDSLKDCISQNKASYHKEMFVFMEVCFTTQFNNQDCDAYFNLMSICQEWKTLYPDAEIHVIGVDWYISQPYKPTEQMRKLWTSYNEFVATIEWKRDSAKAIADIWSPHCYKLLTCEMKQRYLQ